MGDVDEKTEADTETGTPTVWDNGWQEGHAHGLARGLGISYREAWLRTTEMLTGKMLNLDRAEPVTGNQVQRHDGKWVPAIPLPLFGLRKQCQCGAKFWTMPGYRGHYALVHILETP
jgi:hypothetical protein